jgi:hypothetical protein
MPPPARAPRTPHPPAPRPAGRLLTVLLVLALGLAADPRPAEAGAWPRPVGKTFLSLRRDWERSGDGRERSTSVYGEYGLTERVTLGGRWSDHSSVWTFARTGGFVRLALGDLEAANRFAVSLGASTVPDLYMAEEETRIDLGAHWGRGFETRLGGGWATASYVRRISPSGAPGIDDLYGTVGLRPWEGGMVMLSASHYRDEGGTTRTLAPALGVALREGVWAVGTYTHEIGGRDLRAFGLGLWLEF